MSGKLNFKMTSSLGVDSFLSFQNNTYLKCICNEIFECVFSPKIANPIFLMHNDHIAFAIGAEEG